MNCYNNVSCYFTDAPTMLCYGRIILWFINNVKIIYLKIEDKIDNIKLFDLTLIYRLQCRIIMFNVVHIHFYVMQ